MTWGLIRAVLALLVALITLPAVAKPTAEPLTLKLELQGRPVAPTWFAMTGPDRIIVDVSGASAAPNTVDGRGFATKIRLAQFDTRTVRMVIHLAAPARVTGSSIDGRTVSVTLAPTTPQDFARLPRLGRFAATPPAPATSLAAIINEAAPAAKPKPLIVIDAGHGGHDVGAISVHEGRYEKDATLAIAKRIAHELEASGKLRVKLTRDDDRFIPLHVRVQIARKAGAALFLSIHCDSAPNPDAHGSTVYTLSDVASDRMAERAAARENRAGLVAGMELGGEEPEVAGLLFSLVQRGAMNASADFAQGLRAAMGGFRQEAHRFAGFAVLRTGDTPAALLETGYVTNLDDAKMLFSDDGQRRIAKGVRAAVESYFARRQPVLAQAAAAGVVGSAAAR